VSSNSKVAFLTAHERDSPDPDRQVVDCSFYSNWRDSRKPFVWSAGLQENISLLKVFFVNLVSKNVESQKEIRKQLEDRLYEFKNRAEGIVNFIRIVFLAGNTGEVLR
jgi:hypothetical protein